LAERILAEQAALEARGTNDGERKTITALFADIKGSTALIEDLDPEEARAIIDPTLQIMMDAVHRYNGYVAQVLGDGIFALFGAPLAHEDHPQRAVYAALLMQEEGKKYAERLRRERSSFARFAKITYTQTTPQSATRPIWPHAWKASRLLAPFSSVNTRTGSPRGISISRHLARHSSKA
jgi:hypothetical protein